ncbi:MAG: acylphosphatase [Candidatus Pacebacteria bacterium]|nr:acylphosphatase [Candidatus Paceibacterota bacterium]
MIKKIEIGIAGRGLNKSSFSWIEGLASRLLIKVSVLTRPDGSIRVTAEGEAQDLEALAKKIHHGGIFSSVENFFITWSESSEEKFAPLVNY